MDLCYNAQIWGQTHIATDEVVALEPEIRLRGVSKVYEIGATKLRALDNVDLDIMPGEFCCIIGRSGSGKSTLLNMIAGLEPPTRGSIRVAGQSIDRMNEAQLVQFRLKHVGFVFQSFNLFAIHTALDNVAMPLMYKGVPRATRVRLSRGALISVGLESHMMHRPTQMSGGQQQRVGIARALVSKPRILFADEPTGNLDTRTSAEILRLITGIAKKRGTTLIVVTHDPEMAKYADRVVRILDGKVQELIINEDPVPVPNAEEAYAQTERMQALLAQMSAEQAREHALSRAALNAAQAEAPLNA